MRDITVHKNELLTKLEENRRDHRQVFEEALEGFKREVIQRLEEYLERTRQGKSQDVYVSMPVPKDHTADYDRAIAMVKMSVGDRITLSETDFAQYVMDDWRWQREFIGNSYGSRTARSEKFSAYAVDVVD